MVIRLRASKLQAVLKIIRKKKMICLLQREMKLIKNKNIITIIKRNDSMHRIDIRTAICLNNKSMRVSISKALRDIMIIHNEHRTNMRVKKRAIMIKMKEMTMIDNQIIEVRVDRILRSHKDDTIEMIEITKTIEINDMTHNKEITEIMTDIKEEVILEILETIGIIKESMTEERKGIREMITSTRIGTEENRDLRRM